MNSIHYAIKALMKPVGEFSYKGLSCRTRDEQYVRLHFEIGTYCAEIVEVEGHAMH